MIVEPKMFGELFYPFGFPLKPGNITVKNKTIHEIFFGGINITTGEASYSVEDEETLK